jgi:hypothetical protein
MKLLNRIHNLFHAKPELTEEDNLLIEIITKMCEDTDSEFRMEPDDDRYFGQNAKLKYKLVLSDDFIKITNHDFHFTKYGNLRQMTHLISLVRGRIQSDRNEFYDDITKNEIELLKKISNNLTSK